MAVGISASAGSVTVRRTMTDTFGEKLVKSTPLDIDITDGNIEFILEDELLLTNAKYAGSKVTTVRTLTGLPTSAIDALERNISNRAFLTFRKVHPLNAEEYVYKTYGIPAFRDGMQNPDGSIITPVSTGVDARADWTVAQVLFDLIDRLEDNLDYVATNGTHYPGGWTYMPNMSGTGTVTNEIDGQP